MRNERYGAEEALKSEHHAHMVKGEIKTETSLTNIGYRRVYLPIYVFEYEYKGERFAFAVNGQSGVAHGERPYGAGSTKVSTIRALTGNFLGGGKYSSNKKFQKKINLNPFLSFYFFYVKGDRVRLICGDELTQLDGVEDKCYHPEGFYLMLPSSDQFFLVMSVGWVVLGNAGQRDLKLCAQRRMRSMTDEQRKNEVLFFFFFFFFEISQSGSIFTKQFPCLCLFYLKGCYQIR